MTTKAFLMLVTDQVVHGPVVVNMGSVQQETRIYQDGQCMCVILLTFPPGSQPYLQALAALAAHFPNMHQDDLRSVRNWTVQSDAPAPAAAS